MSPKLHLRKKLPKWILTHVNITEWSLNSTSYLFCCVPYSEVEINFSYLPYSHGLSDFPTHMWLEWIERDGDRDKKWAAEDRCYNNRCFRKLAFYTSLDSELLVTVPSVFVVWDMIKSFHIAKWTRRTRRLHKEGIEWTDDLNRIMMIKYMKCNYWLGHALN